MRLADDFAQQVNEAERSVLAAGFLDPVGLNDHAFLCGLSTDDFASARHRWLFYALCACADRGIEPTVPGIAGLALRHKIPIDEDDLCGLVLGTQTNCRMMHAYCATVRHYSRRRKIARKHLRTVGQILDIGKGNIEWNESRSQGDYQTSKPKKSAGYGRVKYRPEKSPCSPDYPVSAKVRFR